MPPNSASDRNWRNANWRGRPDSGITTPAPKPAAPGSGAVLTLENPRTHDPLATVSAPQAPPTPTELAGQPAHLDQIRSELEAPDTQITQHFRALFYSLANGLSVPPALPALEGAIAAAWPKAVALSAVMSAASQVSSTPCGGVVTNPFARS